MYGDGNIDTAGYGNNTAGTRRTPCHRVPKLVKCCWLCGSISAAVLLENNGLATLAELVRDQWLVEWSSLTSRPLPVLAYPHHNTRRETVIYANPCERRSAPYWNVFSSPVTPKRWSILAEGMTISWGSGHRNRKSVSRWRIIHILGITNLDISTYMCEQLASAEPSSSLVMSHSN